MCHWAEERIKAGGTVCPALQTVPDLIGQEVQGQLAIEQAVPFFDQPCSFFLTFNPICSICVLVTGQALSPAD